MKKKRGEIIVISAPSGSGKTSIVKRILKEFPEIVFSVSATTRKKRENETHGVEYFFLTEEEFLKKNESDEFAEWERFYDYYYGTLKSFINQNIDEGKSIILEVDVNGALKIKKNYPESHLIFIVPPSHEELVNRLVKRKTENESDLKKRIERAKMELSIKDKFDYLVHNFDLEKAVTETKSLIEKIIKEK